VGIRRFRGSLARSSIIAIAVLSLAAGVAASDSTKLKADLLGTNENPDADLDGRGKASVSIDVAAGQACFDVSFKDGGTANRGHIHRGGPADNGPIVVAFFDIQAVPAQSGDPRHDVLESTNGLTGCVSANPTVLQEIVDNPSGFYVNLHNARFPGGFVRGQLGD
jgi:CHRD domain